MMLYDVQVKEQPLLGALGVKPDSVSKFDLAWSSKEAVILFFRCAKFLLYSMEIFALGQRQSGRGT